MYAMSSAVLSACDVVHLRLVAAEIGLVSNFVARTRLGWELGSRPRRQAHASFVPGDLPACLPACLCLRGSACSKTLLRLLINSVGAGNVGCQLSTVGVNVSPDSHVFGVELGWSDGLSGTRPTALRPLDLPILDELLQGNPWMKDDKTRPSKIFIRRGQLILCTSTLASTRVSLSRPAERRIPMIEGQHGSFIPD
ncbi:hypothetical protein B0T24DRAFT_3599 [Lasiosphaeria ovina]|uniref:Uncharacterized protein n=1 Tax=Lasiosphaeria ovina TaxID=92902 RepID=A0AAE0NIN2_9PEZI|nr:hypothetical protein B0T24DRAFT_3599 [Lasiosphaeria ovina]